MGRRAFNATGDAWFSLAVNPVGPPRVVLLGPPILPGERDQPLDVVLVRPNETPPSAFYSGKFRENLGVLTLATHLEDNGVRLGVVEGSLFQCTPEITADLATDYRSRYVGIAVYSTYILEDCLQLAALVKKNQPDVHIVLGGHGASFVPTEILEHNPAVDIVISGEAYDSLLQLVLADGRDDWERIPNLSYRRDGKIRRNPRGPVEKDLDMAPLAHRFVREIMEEDPVLAEAPLMTVSSLGCYDRCTFCTVTAFTGATWRGRSPEHVVDELESMLGRFRKKSVHFWDDTFTGPGRMGKRRAIAIADEIKKRGLDVVFHVTARPTDLTEEVVAALASAGMRSAFIGVESSQQEVLTGLFDKHADVEHSHRSIELLWKYGVHRICIGFILFHPEMTWQTFRGDLDLLDGLPTMEIERIMSRLCDYPGAVTWRNNGTHLLPDAYKMPFYPDLPSDEFERLFRVCANFYRQTAEIEMVFICLEERYLDDIEVIDYLADCRTRLFQFISTRARIVADLLEHGCEFQNDARRFYDEIFLESMRIIHEMRGRLGDEYFDVLLAANQLQGYERHLEPTHTARFGRNERGFAAAL